MIRTDNILETIKKMLGMDPQYRAFDTDIRVNINSYLSSLVQMGIGPPEGFMLIDGNEVWSDFLADAKDIEAAKTYLYLKVKIVFDPPSSSSVLEAMNRAATELEWRLANQGSRSS